MTVKSVLLKNDIPDRTRNILKIVVGTGDGRSTDDLGGSQHG